MIKRIVDMVFSFSSEPFRGLLENSQWLVSGEGCRTAHWRMPSCESFGRMERRDHMRSGLRSNSGPVGDQAGVISPRKVRRSSAFCDCGTSRIYVQGAATGSEVSTQR